MFAVKQCVSLISLNREKYPETLRRFEGRGGMSESPAKEF
jgi:hypothetical protein